LRWSKDLPLHSRDKDSGPTLAFAVDAFNVLNRVNYSSFVGDLSSPFFGHAIASQPARRIQAGLKLEF
jgi:hypothetical protein